MEEKRGGSQQPTPELLQGALVARHVDRPWQVALVHVARPEPLLRYFTVGEGEKGGQGGGGGGGSRLFGTTPAIFK